MSGISELGYYGNIWVRQNNLNKGENGGGHEHYFDHVSLLATGSVLVEVDGFESTTYHAPTFIAISKRHKHKITALTDNVVYYCVFALRDVDGEVVDDIISADNNPLTGRSKYADHVDDGYWAERDKLEKLSIHTD